MPIFRCTWKLLKEIDDEPTVDSARSASLLGDWYGHLFTAERRKCIIFIVANALNDTPTAPIG
jgi:hypothetical protein